MATKRTKRTGRNGKRVGRGSTPRRPTDVNQLAHLLGAQSTSETVTEPTDSEVSKVMAALGRRGGKIGGKKRAESLTKARRSEIAMKAARARWGTDAKQA